MSNPATASDLPTPRYISAEDVAKALGVTAATIRRWTRERRISCLKAGKSAARYDLSQVINEITQQRAACPDITHPVNSKDQAGTV